MSRARGIVGLVLAGVAMGGAVAGGQIAPTSVARRQASVAEHSAARHGDSTAAAREFLQKFYDWYAPFVQTEPRYPAWWEILTTHSGELDADLATALRADSAAQRTKPVSREVLDSDPFLALPGSVSAL